MIQADIENHVALWDAIVSTGLITPGERVGLIMAAVWHFVAEDKDPYQVMRFYRDAVVRGSQLALSHTTLDGMSEKMLARVKSVNADYNDQVTSQAVLRSPEEIQRLFGDWTMIPEGSGLCWPPEWHSPLATAPEAQDGTDPTRSLVVCGVAEKP